MRETAAATAWSEDCVRWLTGQACRKPGVSGQLDPVHPVLAADLLPRR